MGSHVRLRRDASSTSADNADFIGALQLDRIGRHEEAVTALRRASAVRHLPSMAFLASRLLVGRAAPLAPGEAIPLMADAARLGSADANLYMANLAALGEGMAQSWAAALRYLRRAAELGSARAQAQIAFLAGEREPRPGMDWGAMARRLDVGAWTAPASGTAISSAPRAYAAAGFITPETCGWLIERARAQLKPATVLDHQSGQTLEHAGRSNSAACFDLLGLDLVILLVEAKLAATLKQPVRHFERNQVLHYAVGQQFAAHYDFLSTPRPPADPAQRIWTALVYLNADYEGGETSFPRVGLKHRGGIGDAFWFASVDAQGQPERLSLHAGLPPSRGEKWVMSQWVRDRGPDGRVHR